MERLCGLLSTVNITGRVTHDTGTCQLGMSIYPFRNLTSEGSIRLIHSEIRSKENKYGSIYREPAAGGKGKPIHDEDETKSFVFQRSKGPSMMFGILQGKKADCCLLLLSSQILTIQTIIIRLMLLFLRT